MLVVVLLLFALVGCRPSVMKYGEPIESNGTFPTESTDVTSSTDPGYIPADLEHGIKSAYLSQYVKDANYSDQDIRIRYYGSYEGVHVCFLDGVFDYPAWETEEIIAGLTFRYSSGQKLMVYSDGNILELTKAYEAGWFSADALSQLLDYYKTVHFYLFEE